MCKKVEIPVETLENWQIFSFILCTSSDKKSISEFVMGFFINGRLMFTKTRLGVRLKEHMARSISPLRTKNGTRYKSCGNHYCAAATFCVY